MRIPKGGVGFFDSGIGGLTVLAECQKKRNEEIYYYYGDNRHAPYGNLPPKKIRRYVFKVFRLFKKLQVKAAVVACNTATAVCIDELRKKFSFPIIGAEPAVCSAAKSGGKVLVLATRATCESERFRLLCGRVGKLFPNAQICIRPCEGLAGAIERNLFTEGYDYTSHLPDEKADAVVLGCTHYIYIVEEIRRFYSCPIFDGNAGIACRLFAILSEIEGDLGKGCTQLTTEWDDRPPDPKIAHKVGLLTTKMGKMADCHNLSNKRSQNTPSKSLKNDKGAEVIFLGKQRKNNQKTHEQMFIWS